MPQMLHQEQTQPSEQWRLSQLTFSNSKKSASDCGSGWQVSTFSR